MRSAVFVGDGHVRVLDHGQGVTRAAQSTSVVPGEWLLVTETRGLPSPVYFFDDSVLEQQVGGWTAPDLNWPAVERRTDVRSRPRPLSPSGWSGYLLVERPCYRRLAGGRVSPN